MKTIEEIFSDINEFQDAPLPGDYSEYEYFMEKVKFFMNKHSVTVDFAVSYYEQLYDIEENCAEKEKFRVMLCCVSYIFIQELLNLRKYVEALFILQITLKKYVISPYMLGEFFQEMHKKAGVLDFDEVKVWDNYILGIFQYFKTVLPAEKTLDLLNIAINFRNDLLEDLEYPTGYEPLFYELKKLKIELLQKNTKKIVENNITSMEKKSGDNNEQNCSNGAQTVDMLRKFPEFFQEFPSSMERKYSVFQREFGDGNQRFSHMTGLAYLQKNITTFQEMKRKIFNNSQLYPNKHKAELEIQYRCRESQELFLYTFFKAIQYFMTLHDDDMVDKIYAQYSSELHVFEVYKGLIENFRETFDNYRFQKLPVSVQQSVFDLTKFQNTK